MSVPTWLPDGLYVLQRGIDMSLGAEKTMNCPAYNDSELDFVPSPPTAQVHHEFLLNDVKMCLAAHYFDGVDIIGFQSSFIYTVMGDPYNYIVDDVTVSAFISGKGRPLIRVGDTNYFGELTTDCHVASWVDTVWTTNPATGQPWTRDALFSEHWDLQLICAGIDLRALADQTYPDIQGSDGVRFVEHPDDPRVYIDGSKCYTLKVTVHYHAWEGMPIESEIIYPDATIDTGMAAGSGATGLYNWYTWAYNVTALSCRWENQINNGNDFSSITWLAINNEILSNPAELLYEDPFDLSIVIPAWAGSFAKVILYYSPDSMSETPFPFYHRPFLKIGGVKYYAAAYTTSTSTVNATYAVNPATGQPWAAGDLAGAEFGAECHRDDSVYPMVGPYQGNVYLNAVHKTRAAIAGLYLWFYDSANNLLGQLNGGVTKASRHTWRMVANNPLWYPYNGSHYVNLCGDLYYHTEDQNLGPPGLMFFEAKTNLFQRYASDFCTLPPSFSQVNGVTVTAQIQGWTDAPDAYWRIFLWIAGDYYYSDSYAFNNYPAWTAEEIFSWTTSPATGLPWTYDELQGARFGVEVVRIEKHDMVHFRLHYLDSDIAYQEIAGPLVPRYIKVSIDDESISLVKESQSPKFKAQELRFVLPAGGYLPERTEIAWVKDGALVFRGIVWRLVERLNREVQVLVKSQQIILAYRHIPSFFYHARNTRFSSVYTLADIFSDACPEYPNNSYWTNYECPDINFYIYWRTGGSDIAVAGMIPYIQGVQLLGATETNLGLFFVLNSLMAYGRGTTRLEGVATLARNRMKFLTNHDPSTVPYNLYSIDWGNRYYADRGSICTTDDVGSVRRFRKGDAPQNLAVDEYLEDGEDLLIGVNEGAYLALFDHAYETFLRPGTNDLSTKFLAVPYTFDKSFETAFSDFFTRLGQEIRFRNEWDGYVYMDAATEFARDTGKRFIHNRRNCTVIKAQRNLRPNAVLGMGSIPLVSTDWTPAPRGMWLTEVLQVGDRDGQDLQEWLDLKIDDDDPLVTIKTPQQEWLLNEGDLIHAQAEDDALESLRIRKITTQVNGSQITAGKRLTSLSDKFGLWQNATGAKDTDHVIQNQEIDLGGPTGSQTFNVLAEEYKKGAWKCKVAVNWSLWTSGADVSVVLPADFFMVLVVKLNGKVIPPGRMMAKDNSGGVVIDITDLCSVSASSDTQNTININLVNGLTVNATRGHKVDGSIKQYRRLEAVLNA